MDPLALPLRRTVSLIWWWLTRNADEKERFKIETRLWQPPQGQVPDPRSPWSAENETALFAAAKRMTANPRSN